MTDRLSGMIGLMCRARGCVFGAEACKNGVRSGKIKLLLTDADTSEVSIKSARDMCAYYKTLMLIVGEPGMLSNATGRANTKFVGVTDMGFAKKLTEMICENSGAEV